MRPVKLVDLFCGAGGFSLGAHLAGFNVAVAVDNDPILSSSYSANFADTRLLTRDVSSLSGVELLKAAGGSIDGIFGGPPCQGFSDIGRRDKDDPRRQLLGHFFRIVKEVEPSFFVMENVRGLANSDARNVLDEALAQVSGRYELLGPHIWDAAAFGAATKRQRLFVVGYRKDLQAMVTLEDVERQRCPPVTVRAAIDDLGCASELGEVDGFDTWKLPPTRSVSKYARGLRAANGCFTGHRPTLHTPKVVQRFQSIPHGGMDKIGRHPRLSWEGQCPTLRAGTGSDKGSYQSVRPIHPDEPRVITAREAARLQGFPDWHLFHPTVWHSFRMIGNSVSPIMARAIFTAIRTALYDETRPR
ncbi:MULTISPECIES: DNA cytosine methyltransferase [unclassified Mesorhizobium]|uniref:DNA cytosine methyltransferase n=1 Tax=unclassified Mesorhizobium TaxID=325217 RepID=UPI00333E0AF7